jgi:dsDNA-specific endonuclease/ATPase MutS2
MELGRGDSVHVSGLGKGVVLEVRNGGRYLVEIKGRAFEVKANQILAMAPEAKKRRPAARPSGPPVPPPRVISTVGVPSSIDLHGRTVDEAVDALDGFLNDALLAGLAEVRVIHGRSGGRIKAAVHTRLRALSVVRAFRVDERNAGVTIVVF